MKLAKNRSQQGFTPEYQQMKVIVHQAIRADAGAISGDALAKEAQIRPPVVIAEEQRILPLTSSNHMIPMVGNFNPCDLRHTPNLRCPARLVNKSTSVPYPTLERCRDNQSEASWATRSMAPDSSKRCPAPSMTMIFFSALPSCSKTR